MQIHALVLIAAFAGCAVDGDSEEYEETESAVMSANRLAGNKLQASKVAGSKLGAGAMSAAVLSQSELARTADGRDVLSYIVSCALPDGAQTSATVGGVRYTFAGSIGLAAGWATRIPTVSERRWVTACVLARTNLYGVSVQLSMRGSHEALAGSLAETLGYLLVEGAFYGDLFDPTGPQLYACQTEIRDLDLALSTQELRACAMPAADHQTTLCGFTYAGKCGVVDLTLAPACNSLLFPYKNCRAGQAVNAPIFSEVITISLSTKLF
jgi:hypothetical protein